MNVGDPVLLTEDLTVIRDEYDNGVRYQDAHQLVPPLLLADTRTEMLHVTKGRAAWEYQWAPGVVETRVTATRLGTILSHRFGLAPPRALLAHRDTALLAHRDTKHPYPCRNLTLFFAKGCSGGELVLCDRHVAFGAQDGWVLCFDGQELHGVAPLRLAKGGWRLSITFYCPTDA